MAPSSEVFKQKLKHKGFFNYSELYTFCYNWLKDEGYNVSEDEYVEKIAGNGKEIQIKWKASKKVSDYVKNEIKAEWHILGLSDAEVQIDGRKEKTNKGDLKISVVANILKDYESKWDDSPVLRFMRDVYDKYIIRETIKKYEDRLEDKAQDFIEQTKSFLNLEGKR
jgi:hypothetical protein